MREQLPFVDQHEIRIQAPRDAVWSRLRAAVDRNPVLGRRASFPEREETTGERLFLAAAIASPPMSSRST